MKKRITILICFLCFTRLVADEVDQLIVSYAESRRNFDWVRINAVDRTKLVALLKELRDGKRDTVAGNMGIGPSTAERMLIDIGDEDTIHRVVLDYHERRRRTVHVADIVQLGQALAIPDLAVDLVSDKFLVYEAKFPDGRTMTVRDAPDSGMRYSSASNILTIVINSRDMPNEVRASAARIKPRLNDDRNGFIRLVADWWRQNEQQLLARQYTRVTPFGTAGTPSIAGVPSASNKPNADTAGVHSTSTKLKETLVRDEPRYWIWLTALAILGLVFLWIKSRRSTPKP